MKRTVCEWVRLLSFANQWESVHLLLGLLQIQQHQFLNQPYWANSIWSKVFEVSLAKFAFELFYLFIFYWNGSAKTPAAIIPFSERIEMRKKAPRLQWEMWDNLWEMKSLIMYEFSWWSIWEFAYGRHFCVCVTACVCELYAYLLFARTSERARARELLTHTLTLPLVRVHRVAVI